MKLVFATVLLIFNVMALRLVADLESWAVGYLAAGITLYAWHQWRHSL